MVHFQLYIVTLVCNLAIRSYCSTVSNFYCYFIHVYVFTVISMICGICSGVISFIMCTCNFNCAVVLLNYIVTLVRLSLVTNNLGYLLTYLLTCDDPHRLRHAQ